MNDSPQPYTRERAWESNEEPTFALPGKGKLSNPRRRGPCPVLKGGPTGVPSLLSSGVFTSHGHVVKVQLIDDIDQMRSISILRSVQVLISIWSC